MLTLQNNQSITNQLFNHRRHYLKRIMFIVSLNIDDNSTTAAWSSPLKGLVGKETMSSQRSDWFPKKPKQRPFLSGNSGYVIACSRERSVGHSTSSWRMTTQLLRRQRQITQHIRITISFAWEAPRERIVISKPWRESRKRYRVWRTRLLSAAKAEKLNSKNLQLSKELDDPRRELQIYKNQAYLSPH